MIRLRRTAPHPRHSIDMTEGPLFKDVLLFSLPLMLSGILQLLFNAADTIVVGRYAGEQALAAVGSVGSLNTLIVSLFMGLSVGSNVVVARKMGARDYKGVQDAVHTSVTISFISGVFLAFAGYFLARPLLLLMGSPEDVIDLSVLYVRIIFMGMPVQMVYNFCAAILRSVGDTKRPLYFLTVAGVINVVLNLIFVICLHMTVDGVALATIISQAVSAVLVVRSLTLREDAVRLDLRRLRIVPATLVQIVRIGLPSGIQTSVFSISNVLIQSSVNSFGTIAMAGNAAAANIGGFVYQGISAFVQATTSFVSQNFGARKPRRTLQAMWVNHLWSFVFTFSLGLISYFFGEQLLSMYNTDPEVISWGLRRILYLHIPYFLCGFMEIFSGALRGIGYSLLPMVISLLGACAFRILWIYTIFQKVRTMDCLLISYPVSWIITTVVMAFFFFLLYKRVCKDFTPEELSAR